MNILLSAYACEPNKGSEPGVGWSWVMELANYHNVWVITRDNNEPSIKNYLKENPDIIKNKNIKFIYVGLPKSITFWKKGRRGMRLFYMMWQKKAYKIAREYAKRINFDLVQHITFVSYTQPTYMYKLGIPMIWGPVAGGENIPTEVKVDMSKKEMLSEFIRKISQKIAIITPSINMTMKKSEYILVATEETKSKIPYKYQNKVKVMPAIGLENIPEIIVSEPKQKVKIIMAGRLIYWKGFDIGIRAYLNIVDKYPNTELHILGEGKNKDKLKNLAGEYLNKNIFFKDVISHDEIFDFYRGYDIFMNTSLRDSGCMTMMEAIGVGLPCIAIATGGPKILSNQNMSIRPEINKTLVKNISINLEILIDSIINNNEEIIDRYKGDREVLTMKYKIEKMNSIYCDILQKGKEKNEKC